MEQTYEDKSNFLFEITQALKEPMLNIKNACDESSKQTKVADLKESLYKIKGYSKEMDFVLNEILNTGSVSSNSVKFIDNKYSIERLYDEIVSRINPVIPKNVKFSSSIAHNIPTLYGDSIKIKQVVMSLLQNSVKHTTNGFIDFQIDTIERFDAIRLIIVIRDSSEGMSIDKINEVLTMSGDLDVRDIEALEQSNISMKLCQKVVKLLGGNMLIKSYDGKGSEILLVIDQKIADTKSNVVEAYESYTSINKTVCVVNQDKQYDNILRTTLKKNHISTSFLLNGNDLIDKIKSGKKYDYIIVGNEMKGINGLSILQELKTIKGFKTPVIIIINENEERIAKHFLEEGFANYIITNNFADDLNTIINKN
jgi:CheY-like chemotaxis protein